MAHKPPFKWPLNSRVENGYSVLVDATGREVARVPREEDAFWLWQAAGQYHAQYADDRARKALDKRQGRRIFGSKNARATRR